MSWLILQLVAVTIAATNGVLDEWLLHGRKLNNPRLFLASVAMVSLPVIAVGAINRPFIVRAMLVGLASGLCFSGAVLLYYRAVACESAIRLALPGRLVAIITLPLNALILHERLSGVQVIAFIVMFISGWLLIIGRDGLGRLHLTRGFWLMLGVEALYMLQDLLKNVLATQYDAWTMLTWERAGVVLGALLALVRRCDRIELGLTLAVMPRQLRALIISRQTTHLLMGLLSGLAIQLAGAATKVVIAGGTYPFAVTILAWLLISRRSSRKPGKDVLLGMLGTLIGVSLLTY
jgi:drug/metabolite transporter (DMT)-like permease